MMHTQTVGDALSDGGYGDVYETEVGDRTPTEAVVDVVAAISDAEPASLEPLYDTVDPEAVDALCASGDADEPTVSFEYCGFAVRIEGCDRVIVTEP